MFSNHLKAVSIGPLAIQAPIRDIGIGKVHSVFRRVVNIIWEDGSLSSISRIDISNGPANIVTNLPVTSDFSQYDLKPGTSVQLNADLQTLYVGSVCISLMNAAQWQSPLAHFKTTLSPDQVKANLAELSEWVRREKTKKYGLSQLFPYLESLLSGTYLPAVDIDPVTYLAGQAINNLLPALYNTDKSIIRDSASALIGLGPGLTPSGDDYLAGLMLSLTACLKFLPETVKLSNKVLIDSIIQLVPGLTNDISRHMLEFAAKGMGSELMENMIFALFFTTHKDTFIIQSAKDLSAVGASSGYDQLLGIMSGAGLYSG